MYIRRIGFSLIRVHRFQKSQLNTNEQELLQSSLKWPIETIYAGIRPSYNIDTSQNPNEYRDWHQMARLLDRNVDVPANSLSKINPDATANPIPTSAQLVTVNSQETFSRQTYVEKVKTVSRITVSAHGIVLFNDFPGEFFADYMPWQYGGWNINTPSDEGALMINFCLYPGTYQPSGHINISRAREFYIKYVSNYIGIAQANNPANDASPTGDLLVIAIAINFLLISDGSAVLRYST